jgi:cysteine desulfurase
MIYLDYNASTPMAPVVKEAVTSAFDFYANPSGTHPDSRVAAARLEAARAKIANTLGVRESEVIFTSGSTEAITLSIWGILLAAPASRTKVLVSSIEHSAVIETARAACKVTGKELILIPANTSDSALFGQVDSEFIQKNLDSETALIAVMAVNNETGVIQPIDQISRWASDCEVPFLCDSTQAIGKWEYFPQGENLGIFMVSGHKIYGPKGSGILIFPRKLQRNFFSISPGGGQERGIRGGTLNLATAVGIATALEFVTTDLSQEMCRQEQLRDRLLVALQGKFDESVRMNAGVATFMIKNTLNLQFLGTPADAILASLRHVEASRVSACSAGVEEPSHVLLAMGRTGKEAEESIRFSLGRFTTETDIEAAIEDVSAAVTRVRALSA